MSEDEQHEYALPTTEAVGKWQRLFLNRLRNVKSLKLIEQRRFEDVRQITGELKQNDVLRASKAYQTFLQFADGIEDEAEELDKLSTYLELLEDDPGEFVIDSPALLSLKSLLTLSDNDVFGWVEGYDVPHDETMLKLLAAYIDITVPGNGVKKNGGSASDPIKEKMWKDFHAAYVEAKKSMPEGLPPFEPGIAGYYSNIGNGESGSVSTVERCPTHPAQRYFLYAEGMPPRMLDAKDCRRYSELPQKEREGYIQNTQNFSELLRLRFISHVGRNNDGEIKKFDVAAGVSPTRRRKHMAGTAFPDFKMLMQMVPLLGGDKRLYTLYVSNLLHAYFYQLKEISNDTPAGLSARAKAAQYLAMIPKEFWQNVLSDWCIEDNAAKNIRSYWAKEIAAVPIATRGDFVKTLRYAMGLENRVAFINEMGLSITEYALEEIERGNDNSENLYFKSMLDRLEELQPAVYGTSSGQQWFTPELRARVEALPVRSWKERTAKVTEETLVDISPAAIRAGREQHGSESRAAGVA